MKVPKKKLLFIGDCNVGKYVDLSHLVKFFRTGSYPSRHISGAYDIFESTINVGDQSVVLEIWESCGSEEYDLIRKSFYYPDTHAIVICYAVNQPSALDQAVKRWLPEARHHCPDVPILLVGLKKDLRQESGLSENDQQLVSIEQASSAAQQINAWKHWECSAKSGERVPELFEYLAQAALEYKPTKWWKRVFM